MIYCTREDRRQHFPGLRLMLLSLSRQCDVTRLLVSDLESGGEFDQWAESCGVALEPIEPPQNQGWNIKPEVLLTALDRCKTRVTWIDADILLLGDLSPKLAALDETQLLAGQEHGWGQAPGGLHRARAWGLDAVRPMAFTVNTGVVSVTEHHRPLLETWRELLADERYQQVQKQYWADRPVHMLSDQEVLTALLSDRRFADVPITWLERSKDIVQAFGPSNFSIGDRLRYVCGKRPLATHAMGPVKPWTWQDQRGSKHERFSGLAARFSLYTHEARPYLKHLPEDERQWANHGLIGSLWNGLCLGSPALTDLPMAGFESIVRVAKSVLKIKRYRVEGIKESGTTTGAKQAADAA